MAITNHERVGKSMDLRASPESDLVFGVVAKTSGSGRNGTSRCFAKPFNCVRGNCVWGQRLCVWGQRLTLVICVKCQALTPPG
jgi:hypothetical protein